MNILLNLLSLQEGNYNILQVVKAINVSTYLDRAFHLWHPMSLVCCSTCQVFIVNFGVAYQVIISYIALAANHCLPGPCSM